MAHTKEVQEVMNKMVLSNHSKEMFAALQEIASWDFVQTPLEKKAVAIARAAIAKATEEA